MDTLRTMDYNNYPILRIRDSLFVGRGQALSELETEQLLKSNVKAVFITGIPHVGRKRFALQYLRKVLSDDRLSFCSISMELGKSIEDLALYINDFVELFETSSLISIMVNEKISAKIDYLIQLFNELYNYKQYILIYDDFCLVSRTGHIVDWFQEVLRSPKLINHTGIFIISKVGIDNKEINILPIIQKQLLPLENRDIQAIIKAYSSPQSLSIPEADMNTIVTSVNGFPGYVYPVIDSWVKYNRFTAMELLRTFEKSISDVLDYLVDILNEKGNESRIQLLLLLAHFGVISIKQLQQLFDDPSLEELLNSFKDLSVLEFFGYSREYVRIHPVVADFLKRSKRISLSKDFISKLSKRAATLVREIDVPESNEEIVTYMYGIKCLLKTGLNTEKDLSKYLIPSIALNVIVEEYEEKNYPGVLALCERMLSGSKNFDDHMEWNIKYWYCLALCRTKDTRLFEVVNYFKGRTTYHFLVGFYYRLQGQWGKAEEEYGIALSLSDGGSDSIKLKQEIVLVRIQTGDYSGALELAEENYKRQRFNSFYIEAYFRCLVKDPYSDPGILKSLINDMNKSQDKNHREIADTMSAEYAYYFEGDFWGATKMLQNVITSYPSMQYSKEAFASICREAKRPQVYKDFMKNIH